MRLSAFLALALTVAACTEDPAPDAGPTLSVRALYEASLYDGDAMRVRHEAIPGVMPAMRMDLRVRTPGLLDGVPEGALLQLTLDSLSYAVLDLEVLPPGTELDLAPGPDDGSGVSFDP